MKTKRLLLRPWKPSDLEPFAALNADRCVMEFFPKTLTKKESDDLAHLIQTEIDQKGYGLWAVEIPNTCPFIGFVGLHAIDFMPGIEIGWRLSHNFWGQGYAFEAAVAVRDHAFASLHIPELLSFTYVGNMRSRRLMEKLGMTHSPADDFLNPKLPENHPLRPHVLYRLQNQSK